MTSLIGKGVAREQARLFLPGFSMYFAWGCKVDAPSTMRHWHQRWLSWRQPHFHRLSYLP